MHLTFGDYVETETPVEWNLLSVQLLLYMIWNQIDETNVWSLLVEQVCVCYT